MEKSEMLQRMETHFNKPLNSEEKEMVLRLLNLEERRDKEEVTLHFDGVGKVVVIKLFPDKSVYLGSKYELESKVVKLETTEQIKVKELGDIVPYKIVEKLVDNTNNIVFLKGLKVSGPLLDNHTNERIGLLMSDTYCFTPSDTIREGQIEVYTKNTNWRKDLES